MLNKQRVIQIVKLIVFVLACYFIYNKLFSDGQFKFFEKFKEVFTYEGIKILLLILFLMICNWMMEAIKWQYVTSTIQKLTIKESLISILQGVYLSLLTPNRIGDGIGKIKRLKKSRRSRGTYAFLITSISQVLVVSIMGFAALLLSPVKFINDPHLWIVFKLIVGIGTALLIVAYYYQPWRKKLAYYIGKMWGKRAELTLTTHQLNTIFALSFIRYGIFTTQFFLALKIFGLNMDFLSSQICIGMMYLFSTWIPSLLMGDLGVRESVAIAVFSKFTLLPEIAFVSSILIWIVNLLIPAIIGMILFTFNRNKS